MRYRICLAILAAAFCACAVIEHPSGGPEDKEPPRISRIIPSEDSSGVARDAKVSIEFSEKVDGESFKSRIVTYPPLEFRKIETKGNIVELEFKEDLPETTICVLLKGGFKDDHLIVNRKNYQFCFSTAERLDTGSISGKILFKQKPDSAGVAMLVKIVETDTLGELYSAEEARMAFTDGFGNYTIRGLPSDGTPFLLWAFIDSDQDGKFSFGKDFFQIYPDTLSLSFEESGRRGIDINIIDPDEPGSVEGVVTDLTGTEELAFLRLDRAAGSVEYFAVLADTAGVFRFPRVSPGDFILTAFKDINADSLAGEYSSPDDSTIVLTEPFYVYPDTVKVLPGEDKRLDPFELSGNE